jgi:hypothetical protein
MAANQEDTHPENKALSESLAVTTMYRDSQPPIL